jgi:hypothetical protein
MLPVPTKIRAVVESPTAPHLDCYDATDIDSLAALAVSKVFATTPITHTKKDSKMAGNNYTGVVLGGDALPSSAKRHVFGIQANDNAQAIIGTLNRLGLCPHAYVADLKYIAAAGKPIGHLFSVTLQDLDRALSNVDATAGDKIGFKASLRNAGLLKN